MRYAGHFRSADFRFDVGHLAYVAAASSISADAGRVSEDVGNIFDLPGLSQMKFRHIGDASLPGLDDTIPDA
jgi:hypothetical protein